MPAARKTRTTKKADNQSAKTTRTRAKAKQAEVEADEDEDEEEDDEPKSSTRRQITPEIAQRAIDMRAEGAKWSEVIEELGFNGAQLRPHMARLEEAKIDTLEDTPESVAEHREEGYAWYAMATSLGKTIAEVKAMAEEGGADVSGRKYRGNGAAEAEDESDEDEAEAEEDEDEEEDEEEDEDEEEEEEPAPKRRTAAKKSSSSKPAASKSSGKTTRRRPSKAA